jgi:hypothetical protein
MGGCAICTSRTGQASQCQPGLKAYLAALLMCLCDTLGHK